MVADRLPPREIPQADQTQVGGDHYVKHKIQPWHAMEDWMSPEEFRGFLRGNVIKYVARCNDKGGRKDLEKAQHYLTKLLEVSEDTLKIRVSGSGYAQT